MLETISTHIKEILTQNSIRILVSHITPSILNTDHKNIIILTGHIRHTASIKIGIKKHLLTLALHMTGKINNTYTLDLKDPNSLGQLNQYLQPIIDESRRDGTSHCLYGSS